MLGLLSHTYRNGKSSLIWVVRIEVQRAVVKFSYFEGSVEFGYAISSAKLLSSLPGEEGCISIQILAHPWFCACYASYQVLVKHDET